MIEDRLIARALPSLSPGTGARLFKKDNYLPCYEFLDYNHMLTSCWSCTVSLAVPAIPPSSVSVLESNSGSYIMHVCDPEGSLLDVSKIFDAGIDMHSPMVTILYLHAKGMSVHWPCTLERRVQGSVVVQGLGKSSTRTGRTSIPRSNPASGIKMVTDV